MTRPSRPRTEALRPYAEAIRGLPPERLLSLDGQRVHLWRRGAGQALVLLHGLAASSYSFRELAPRLEGEFELVAIDLNGFGLTERPRDPARYGLEGQAALVAGVLDRLGLASADLLGHSFGAAVAATLAKQQPDRFRRLVFVSPAATFDRLPWYLRLRPGQEALFRIARGLLSDPERYRRVAGRAFHRPEAFPSEASEVYRSHLLVEGLRDTWFGFLREMRDPSFPGAAYDGLRHPALVLAGGEDRIVPVRKCEALLGRLPSARLEVLEDCGHSAPEEKPDELAAILRRFLLGS
jgi:pimeloyl-ACP methyl ester carboxylesterase